MRQHYLAFLAWSLVAALSTPAIAQSVDQVAMVRTAQGTGSYAISGSKNKCPVVTIPKFGWPEGALQYCEYTEKGLPGSVYLLVIEPAVIARWIDSACSEAMPGETHCFRVVLACGKLNSGMMFPVSGNIIENRKNYYFRQGVTVRLRGFPQASTQAIPLDRQRELNDVSENEIMSIPSGLTRFWLTRPRHMAIYSDLKVLKALDRPSDRQQWLSIVRSEMSVALKGPRNRLLDAYVFAHRTTLKALLGGMPSYSTCPS